MTEEEYKLGQKYINIQRVMEFLKYDLDGIAFAVDALCEDGTNNFGAKTNAYSLIDQARKHVEELRSECVGW